MLQKVKKMTSVYGWWSVTLHSTGKVQNYVSIQMKNLYLHSALAYILEQERPK